MYTHEWILQDSMSFLLKKNLQSGFRGIERVNPQTKWARASSPSPVSTPGKGIPQQEKHQEAVT